MIEEEWPKKTESGNYKYPEADESERPASAEVEQPSVDIHSACLDKARVKEAIDKACKVRHYGGIPVIADKEERTLAHDILAELYTELGL